MYPVDLRDRIRLDELDPGIQHEVEVLAQHGVETYESCQGGEGHSYAEPTVAFHGDRAEGLRAYAIAHWQGLLVWELRRVWAVEDGELVGPQWNLVFRRAKGEGNG